MVTKGTRTPVRILHVLGGMDRAGAETWLMHILRSIDRTRYQMDFLVHNPGIHDYDEEIRALGSAIILCPHTRNPLRYARDFGKILREHGPYDVVHSHVHHYSGLVLRLATRAGVPTRIAHSHLDDAASTAQASPQRRAYLALMRRWLAQHATDGLAASEQAAVDLFGPAWADDPRFRVLPCGVDLDPFARPVCSRDVRAALGIPADAFVVGHVGRFTDQKNHAFLLAIAAEVARRDVAVRFLLIGAGELRPVIEERAGALGLGGKIIFAGSRADVPQLLLGGMDAFVFPSRYEGLGLAVVEAQAAGLRCVVADGVPGEADAVPSLVRRLSLGQTAGEWAGALLGMRGVAPPVSQAEALRIVRATPFDVRTSWAQLERVYQRPWRRSTPISQPLRAGI